MSAPRAWGARGRRFKSCRPDCMRQEALWRERRRAFLFLTQELRPRVESSNKRYRTNRSHRFVLRWPSSVSATSLGEKLWITAEATDTAASDPHDDSSAGRILMPDRAEAIR